MSKRSVRGAEGDTQSDQERVSLLGPGLLVSPLAPEIKGSGLVDRGVCVYG